MAHRFDHSVRFRLAHGFNFHCLGCESQRFVIGLPASRGARQDRPLRASLTIVLRAQRTRRDH